MLYWPQTGYYPFVPFFFFPLFPFYFVPLFHCSIVPFFLCSFVPLFLCSFVHLFLCSFVHSLICSFVCLFLGCPFVSLFLWCAFVPLSLCAFVHLSLFSFVPLSLCPLKNVKGPKFDLRRQRWDRAKERMKIEKPGLGLPLLGPAKITWESEKKYEILPKRE